MTTVGQDVRYAWRTFRRSPGFAALAILTLGLGVGATTTIFTVVHGVLMRPLPYRAPDRLANLWVDFGVGAQSLPAMSPGDFRDYQQRNRSFEMLAAGSGGQVVGATGALTGPGGEPERVDVSPVTANFLPLLGVDPIYGRHFTAEEETPGGAKVVILSHGLWKRRYGADPGIVGSRIRLDGLDQTVVGVMPEGFRLVAAVGGVPDHRLADLEADAVQLRQPAAAQFHFLHGVRPSQAGRHVRAGAGGSVRDRAAAPRRARGARGGRHADPRRAAPGRRREARAAGARGAVRGGWFRAADRVRERRAPAPRAGDGAGARDGGARRARRRPRAAPSAALD